MVLSHEEIHHNSSNLCIAVRENRCLLSRFITYGFEIANLEF